MDAQLPTIGRIVLFRSRIGAYTVPAVVTATVDTLAPAGVAAYEASGGEKGVPPLSSSMSVHLTVLTPGIPRQRGDANDFLVDGVRVGENEGGSYQEWDVPLVGSEPAAAWLGDEQAPGTWAWPTRS